VFIRRDLCKTPVSVILNGVKDLYIRESQIIEILHCVQKDSLLRFCKGLRHLRDRIG